MKTKLIAVFALCFAALAFGGASLSAQPTKQTPEVAPLVKNEKLVQVENFEGAYQPSDTPEAEWNREQDKKWILGFSGTFKNQKELSYRGVTLAVGTHDMWVEDGKGEWLYFIIGNKKDSEAPRLKAMFRLYEQEKGVSKTQLKLKLTRKKTKLKFSLFAGQSEGHGNLKVVEEVAKESP